MKGGSSCGERERRERSAWDGGRVERWFRKGVSDFVC